MCEQLCINFTKEHPKLKWMFISTNLLDLQKVDWDYYKEGDNSKHIPVITYEYTKPSSGVYINKNENNEVQYDILFNKGKYDLKTDNGQHALKVASFSSMYLKKFSGSLRYTFYGDVLLSIIPIG